MRSKTLLIGVIGVVVGVLLSTAVVFAGSLNPTSGPNNIGSQRFTLQQIYDRLTSGATGFKMTTFTEPTSGPTAGTMRTLDEILAVAPALDDTNGATRADVANGKTFWGLTSGQWALQTGTRSLSNTYNPGVPKTGQTTSYATGDDGDLERGVAWPVPRFMDHGDGTVTDNLTGLIWLKNSNCAGSGSPRTWSQALSDVVSLNTNGTINGNNCGDASNNGSHRTDWRLPNVREMQSLIGFNRSDPALPAGHPFTIAGTGFSRWTSTTYIGTTSNAWKVELEQGYVTSDAKINFSSVWPVRGGP